MIIGVMMTRTLKIFITMINRLKIGKINFNIYFLIFIFFTPSYTYQNYRIYFSILAAFLISSCVLLVITVVVYSYHQDLLNDYTRLMRHYAVQLCIALLLLAVSKIWKHRKFSLGVSRFIGKHLLF